MLPSALTQTEKKQASLAEATGERNAHVSGKRAQVLNLKLVLQRKDFTSVCRYSTSTSAKRDARMKYFYSSLSKAFGVGRGVVTYQAFSVVMHILIKFFPLSVFLSKVFLTLKYYSLETQSSYDSYYRCSPA